MTVHAFQSHVQSLLFVVLSLVPHLATSLRFPALFSKANYSFCHKMFQLLSSHYMAGKVYWHSVTLLDQFLVTVFFNFFAVYKLHSKNQVSAASLIFSVMKWLRSHIHNSCWVQHIHSIPGLFFLFENRLVVFPTIDLFIDSSSPWKALLIITDFQSL